MMKSPVGMVGLVSVCALFLAASCSSSYDGAGGLPAPESAASHDEEQAKEVPLPFPAGETVVYSIRSVGMPVGTAVLAFHGITQYEGRDAFLITFRANAPAVVDDERIYADIETFYPLRVERDINIFGKKEKITEVYDQARGTVSIEKDTGESQVIDKGGMIDNIYCFIYRYRRSGDFRIGDSFSMRLPTRDVAISLVRELKFRAAGKTFDAFYMESVPAQYRVWFDAGEDKIPLSISGSVGMTAAVLRMTEYRPGGQDTAE